MNRDLVLVVDDNSINRDMLTIILEVDYPNIICAENGVRALEAIEKYERRLSVILLDIIMPVMDGLEVLHYMNKNNLVNDIPVLIISSDTSASIEKQVFDLGAIDFIKKPFNTAIIRRRIRNAVDLFNYKNNLEEKIKEQTIQLKEQTKKLERNKLNVIDVIGAIVESRNMESNGHIKRVKKYTNIIAKKIKILYPEYGLTDELVDIITNVSSLHDIGKISIPDNILLKQDQFTDEEYEIMKTHTTKGCKMLVNIEGVWDEIYDKIGYNICRYHHERYDGKGYPDNLVGDEIPIEAQIVSIADVYDALTNKRCYKDTISKDKAIDMIANGECGQFSPKMIDCLLLSKDEL